MFVTEKSIRIERASWDDMRAVAPTSPLSLKFTNSNQSEKQQAPRQACTWWRKINKSDMRLRTIIAWQDEKKLFIRP